MNEAAARSGVLPVSWKWVTRWVGLVGNIRGAVRFWESCGVEMNDGLGLVMAMA